MTLMYAALRASIVIGYRPPGGWQSFGSSTPFYALLGMSYLACNMAPYLA